MSRLRIYGDQSGYLDLVAPDSARNNVINLDGLISKDSNGNVGIGTDTPVTKLDVAGEIVLDGVITAQGTTGGVDGRIAFSQDGEVRGWIGVPQWSSEGAVLIYGPDSDGPNATIEPFAKYVNSQLELRTNNINRIVIDSTGDVGIGTSAPHELLEVVDRAPVLQIRDTNTGVTDNKATLRLAESGPSSSTGEYYDLTLDNGNFYIVYSQTPRLAIDRTTGNVGIGTNAPQTTLDVNGTITDDVGAVRTPRRTAISTDTTIADEGVYYCTSGPTLTLGNPAVGTIITIYNNTVASGTMTLNRGSDVANMRIAADNTTTNKTSVTLGAYSTTTVTIFTADLAVVSGTDVT